MKTKFVLILALCFSVPAVAQQPAAPAPNPNPVTAAFKGRTMSLQRILAQAFDSIPESKFGYKPTPAQLSIGFIAQHVASDNYLFCNTFGSMKATIPDADSSTPDSVKATWPKDSLVSKL